MFWKMRDDPPLLCRRGGPSLPVLSAYLGHAEPASTYWYLQACPELLALAAQRLERQAGEPR